MNLSSFLRPRAYRLHEQYQAIIHDLHCIALSLIALLPLVASCGGKDSNSVVLIPVSGTLSGVVVYEDKEYDQNGFTGALTNKPVRFAAIEVVNNLTNTVLASASTDATGAYNISYTSFVGYPVKLRVIASAGPLGDSVAEVRNLQGQVYAVSALILSTGVNVTIPVSNPAGGAFNILDVLTSGSEFVNSLEEAYPPEVVAYWEPDTSSAYGTAFCTGACTPGPGIYIIGDSGGDTDGYDDDVIWHEYGHFVAETYSRDDSPGGTHFLWQNNLDLRLAWSEGWADFFPGVVKSWLSANFPSRKSSAAGVPDSRYVDTPVNITDLSFDFGNPGGDPYIYSSSEVAVAKILHDLSGGFGMNAVWTIVDTYIQNITLPSSLEVFWDGWYSIYNTDIVAMTTSKNILNSRNIFFELDPSPLEPDDTFAEARLVTVPFSEMHYLYQPAADDHDFVSFSAGVQQYTVNAVNLSNRLSLIVTVYRADKTTVIPASLGVPFTAPAETIYIEVKPYPARPSSYGRYGTYALTIN